MLCLHYTLSSHTSMKTFTGTNLEVGLQVAYRIIALVINGVMTYTQPQTPLCRLRQIWCVCYNQCMPSQRERSRLLVVKSEIIPTSS